MTTRIASITAGICLATTLAGECATGLEWIDANTNLNFYGDLRLRYEVDWDSQTAAGQPRDDRNRGRLRARVGFDYHFSDEWSTGARLRTGDSRGQQSPHLTFVTDDGERDDLDFVVDRYFVRYEREALLAWAGRNTNPFWHQNELFWDDDVTPTGLAGSYANSLGEGQWTATGGAFYLPDGGYDLNGQMLAGQVVFRQPIQSSQFTVAAGLHYMHGEEGANNLLTRNGERDYLIGVGNAQWRIPIQKIPVTFGADLFYNFENYSAADTAPFPTSDDDETLGYVFSVQVGQLKRRHDWLLAYYYAHIETFSVNASYAQDDWVRFGSGPQTSSSDIEGHELRAGYAISDRINVLARLYLVESITTRQDGNRFRLDLNWKF